MTTQEKCQAEFTLITKVNYDKDNVLHQAIIDDMVKFKDNQADNLGLSAINLNSISETYLTDYPIYIKRQLARLTKNVSFM